MGRNGKLGAVIAGVVIVAVLSLVFASSGVRDGAQGAFGTVQPEADELTLDLDIQAAYNDEDVFFRFGWETDSPSINHDFLVYEGGEWVRYGGEPDGSGLPMDEDRITFLLDDGSVDRFEQYGGFMTVFSFTRAMSPEDQDEDEVEAVFGEDTDDLRKMLPETMEDDTDWRTRRSDDELAELQEAGYFLDLWHWRGHRSNPIGYSDSQYVLDHRISADGEGPYSTNFDDDTEMPEYMFDPDATGQHAMDWDRVLALEYTQDDHYFLSPDTAVEFDPDHDWQEGDAIPRRFLDQPEGPRGEIFAQGVAQDGRWDVELQRALDTGAEGEHKVLEEFGRYHLAPAVHSGFTGNRWHFIGMPLSLGLGRDADIEAQRFDGDRPDWDAIEPMTTTLFYPGVIAYDYLTDSDEHAGAGAMQGGTPFSVAHEVEDMAYYALESEFRSEIKTQWVWTGLVWILFIIAASVAVIRLGRNLAPPDKTLASTGTDKTEEGV